MPVFTDDEAQAQYSRVINKARSKNASAEVNLVRGLAAGAAAAAAAAASSPGRSTLAWAQGPCSLTGAPTVQGLVTILVMVGLGVVFGLPYMVARNRRR